MEEVLVSIDGESEECLRSELVVSMIFLASPYYCGISELSITAIGPMGCTKSSPKNSKPVIKKPSQQSPPSSARPTSTTTNTLNQTSSANPQKEKWANAGKDATNYTGNHAAGEEMRSRAQKPEQVVGRENVDWGEDDEHTHHGVPYVTPPQSKQIGGPAVPGRFQTSNLPPGLDFPLLSPFPEVHPPAFDPSKSVTLTLRDLTQHVIHTTTVTLNKSTDSLYTAVRVHLPTEKFHLIHQGKVLPEDKTPLGAYGVKESGVIDCVFLSLKA